MNLLNKKLKQDKKEIKKLQKEFKKVIDSLNKM
ncbi:hypothetical protein F10086_5 [Staphylococcus phage vB_SauM_JDF86]|nr:hypothetical protein F10086_5 [Staphylococcus phage vB_SauM_JDF86]